MIRTPYALHFTLHARETNQPWRGEKQEKFKNQHLTPKPSNEFIRKKVRRLEGRFKEIFPVLVTYMITESDVEEYVKNKGIALYYSYDF